LSEWNASNGYTQFAYGFFNVLVINEGGDNECIEVVLTLKGLFEVVKRSNCFGVVR
jgi:hypothetical protein